MFYNKTIDMDAIHIIHISKKLKRGCNKQYEENLYKKKMQLLKKELQQGI